MTTSGAICADKIGIVTILNFQCMLSITHPFIQSLYPSLCIFIHLLIFFSQSTVGRACQPHPVIDGPVDTLI